MWLTKPLSRTLKRQSWCQGLSSQGQPDVDESTIADIRSIVDKIRLWNGVSIEEFDC